MSDAIKIFSGPNDTDKRVGINTSTDPETSDALWVEGNETVNGELAANSFLAPEGGQFGPIYTANIPQIDPNDPNLPAVGVGAVPQTARTLELASNWMLNPGAGTTIADTTDVLASALAQPSGTIKAYRAVAGYSGTLPDSNFASGTFLVNRRYTTSISVIAFPATASYGIAINTSTNGSTWSGWQQMYKSKAFTPTLTSSSMTFSNIVGRRQGDVIFLSFDAKLTAAIAVGGTASFSISGLPTIPVDYLRSRVISGTLSADVFIPKNGSSCGIRNLGSASIGVNYTLSSISFCYITT